MVRAFAGDSTITSGLPFPDRTFLPFVLLLVVFLDEDFFFELLPDFFADDFVEITAGFSKPSCAGVTPMRNSLVPQTAQTPVVIAAPRLVNPGSACVISLFSLHLKQ